MSWTSNEVTQNGNTTLLWTATGGSLSTHDAVVVGPTVKTNSIIRSEFVQVGTNPVSYGINVRVIGADAVAFKFFAEKTN